MTTLTLSAYLNQRFQFTYDVTAFATTYPSIASATWYLQVRPVLGSPVVMLDFRTGGSPMSSAAIITYDSGAKKISIKGPTSLMVGLAAGTYVFDFGFTLPGADFERVNGGTIIFQYGSVYAGVAGSPAAPSGSDDTVTSG